MDTNQRQLYNYLEVLFTASSALRQAQKMYMAVRDISDIATKESLGKQVAIRARELDAVLSDLVVEYNFGK